MPRVAVDPGDDPPCPRVGLDADDSVALTRAHVSIAVRNGPSADDQAALSLFATAASSAECDLLALVLGDAEQLVLEQTASAVSSSGMRMYTMRTPWLRSCSSKTSALTILRANRSGS